MRWKNAALILPLMFAQTSTSWGAAESKQFNPDVRCGSHCLYVALDALGLGPATFGELEKSLGRPGPKGYTMRQLEQEAQRRGAKTLGVTTTIEQLKQRNEKFACIAFVNNDHFVLIYDADEKNALIVDPPRALSLPRTVLGAIWNGEALLLSTKSLESHVSNKRQNLAIWLGAISALFLACFAVVAVKSSRKLKIPPLLLATALTVATGCEAANTDASSSTHGNPASSQPVGRLVIVPEKMDVGRVFRTDVNRTHQVHAALRNTGSGILHVLGTSSSCDCTTVAVDNSTIPANASAKLDISFKLGDFRGPRTTYIKVRTDDPESPEKSFRIDWQSVNPISIASQEIRVAPLRPREDKRVSEVVYLEGLQLCPNCSISAGSELDLAQPTVTLKPLVPRDGHDAGGLSRRKSEVAVLTVRLTPQIDYQAYNDKVTLKLQCNNSTRAQCILPIGWSVAPRIGVSPSRLYLGACGPAETVRKTLILTDSLGKPFRVKRVHAAAANRVAPEELPIRDATVHFITVGVTVPMNDGPWRETLTIETNSPDVPEITIPMSGVVAKGSHS